MMFALPASPTRSTPTSSRALTAADPARRPRAELLHVDGADGRLVARQHVRLDLGRHLRAVGPAARRRQPGLLEMLEEIRHDGGDVNKYVEHGQGQEDGVRLLGFGHRVYKNYDPRARSSRSTADRLLGKLGVDDDLLEIARQLEEVALTDDYFIERKLYPNVDFYSGSSTARWASRRRCSRCCSRSAACPAGSRTGWRCTRARRQDRPSAPDLHRPHRAQVRRPDSPLKAATATHLSRDTG